MKSQKIIRKTKIPPLSKRCPRCGKTLDHQECVTGYVTTYQDGSTATLQSDGMMKLEKKLGKDNK
jgi:hypothetical protein